MVSTPSANNASSTACEPLNCVVSVWGFKLFCELSFVISNVFIVFLFLLPYYDLDDDLRLINIHPLRNPRQHQLRSLHIYRVRLLLLSMWVFSTLPGARQ